jgi:hypothetical protein
MSIVKFYFETEDEENEEHYLCLQIEAEVEPGFAGSHSYNAPSDIDYYGQSAQFDGVQDVLVYDKTLPGTERRQYRKPTAEEQVRIDAYLTAHDKDVRAAALQAYESHCEDVADADVDRRIDEARDRELEDGDY